MIQWSGGPECFVNIPAHQHFICNFWWLSVVISLPTVTLGRQGWRERWHPSHTGHGTEGVCVHNNSYNQWIVSHQQPFTSIMENCMTISIYTHPRDNKLKPQSSTSTMEKCVRDPLYILPRPAYPVAPYCCGRERGMWVPPVGPVASPGGIPWPFAGPVEVASLVVECPWLVVVNDVRKNFFYASFMTFFLYLTDKHLEVRGRGGGGEGGGWSLLGFLGESFFPVLM